MSNVFPRVFDDVAVRRLLREEQTKTTFRCPVNMRPKDVSSARPGDLIYIKESWAICVFDERIYRADYRGGDKSCPRRFRRDCRDGNWRSARSMMREMSRITLEVTDVSLSKLSDVTVDDVMAEGVPVSLPEGFLFGDPLCQSMALARFRKHWVDQYGLDSWQRNDDVSVIKFKVHRCNVNEFLAGLAYQSTSRVGTERRV